MDRMRPLESKRFHQAADQLWSLAEQAKADNLRELESALKQICDMLHARGSGIRSRLDDIIGPGSS